MYFTHPNKEESVRPAACEGTHEINDRDMFIYATEEKMVQDVAPVSHHYSKSAVK